MTDVDELSHMWAEMIFDRLDEEPGSAHRIGHQLRRARRGSWLRKLAPILQDPGGDGFAPAPSDRLQRLQLRRWLRLTAADPAASALVAELAGSGDELWRMVAAALEDMSKQWFESLKPKEER